MSPAFISIKESLGIEGVQIGLAFLIDLLVGDPRWLPHPVRFMGFLIERLEFILRKVLRGAFLERIGGLLLVLFMVSFIFLFSCLVVMLYGKLLHSLNSLGRVLSSLFFVFLLSTTIATRGLASACIEVIGHLKEGNLFQARRSLSMIVGRDTENLSEEGVLRATLESLSENLSDGVIAPLFYLTIGGLPLAMTYKAINTMDSMIGYKNERYRYFGWAAARLDDIVNYIPARLSAALIIIATFLLSATVSRTHCRRNGLAIGYTLPICSGCGALSFRRSIVVTLRDGKKSPSPNSGYPEAALAGALGIRLGGPSTYKGVLVEKPFIGLSLRQITIEVAEEAMSLFYLSAFMGGIIAVGVRL